MAEKSRTILFGLRTNVRFFASNQGFAALDTRLKSLALLYDELLFETGIYECSVGETGSFEAVVPLIDERQLKPRRTRRGVPMGVMMQKTGTTEWHTMLSTTGIKAFRAQFITTLDQLAKLKPNWVHSVTFQPGGRGYRVEEEASKVAGDWNWSERQLVETAFPTLPHFLRNKVHENLNLDLARASIIGVDLAPDGLHVPLLEAKAAAANLHVELTGERALRFVLPDLQQASWEDVVALRKLKGLTRLRDKLRELDLPALDDAALAARLQSEYLDELERHKPKWWSTAITAALTIVGVIPPAGTVIGAVGGAAQAGAGGLELWGHSRHWTSALIKARRRLKH